ncbi:hypothetical protein BZA77DRAFT_358097 [Pyronema omphalodes]|nr:hypothetical protein BZA77DRAFT_358097 [Pyronema omphalodes]
MTLKLQASDIPKDLSGKVAIVTGAKSGLGYQTTYLLARAGCTVYLAGRGEAALKDTIIRLTTQYAELSSDHLHALECDLSSTATAVASARSFPGDRLDIIIANAGISLQNDTETSPEGWEKHFQTNHLGHFAFITELLPKIESTAETYGSARVVVVASEAYKFVSGIDFEAIRKPVVPGLRGLVGCFKRYGQSKLANIMFAQELDRRLKAKGQQKVFVAAINPGAVATNLGGSGEQLGYPEFIGKAVRSFGRLAMFSDREGAMTQTLVATAPQVVEQKLSGQYFLPSLTWLGRWDYSKPEDLKPHASDVAAQKKLWDISQAAINDALKTAGMSLQNVS